MKCPECGGLDTLKLKTHKVSRNAYGNRTEIAMLVCECGHKEKFK